VRKGRQPWYLLTNEAVENEKQAWKLVLAYARRMQIEQSFRFTKSELCMESCRLWFWENKVKLLQVVAVAIEPESGTGKLLHRFSVSV
jgi:hypothetical protein